mgnify:CR=1 FL=1
MYDLVLKNCDLVNENCSSEVDIAIKNQRIEKIASNIDSGSKEVLDCAGKLVIPGLIDDQVHFREPGLTHKGEIATESKAAIAGGVTSYFEMPNVNPNTSTIENLNKKFEEHISHLIIHGTLHLYGFDHENDKNAVTMENMERHIMSELGYNDPYGIIQ